MNTMTEAFMKSGLPVPSQSERIWNVVKEFGQAGCTYRDVTGRLSGIKAENVSTLLCQLERRGVIYSKDVGSRITNGQPRKAKHYFTDLEKFERGTPPPKPKAKGLTAGQEVALDKLLTPTPGTIVAVPSPLDIDHLTIAQARELYNKLKGMFA